MRRKKIINYKIFSHFFSGLVEWTNACENHLAREDATREEAIFTRVRDLVHSTYRIAVVFFAMRILISIT